MRIVKHYSHFNGFEYLLIHKPELWEEIQKVIADVDADEFRTQSSEDKEERGNKLYATIELNRAINSQFQNHGWKESRSSLEDTKDVALIRNTMNMSAASQKEEIKDSGQSPISSHDQTDLMKDRVALEVQFREYALIVFDLFVRNMAFYAGDVIDLGIEILPMKKLQAKMSSGSGYYERETNNLIRQGRNFMAVPLIIIGIAP